MDELARNLSDINDRLIQAEDSIDKANQDLADVSYKAEEDMKKLSEH
jgi:hypothetical protein